MCDDVDAKKGYREITVAFSRILHKCSGLSTPISLLFELFLLYSLMLKFCENL